MSESERVRAVCTKNAVSERGSEREEVMNREIEYKIFSYRSSSEYPEIDFLFACPPQYLETVGHI